MVLEAAHQVRDGALVVLPVFFIVLHLELGVGQLLVEDAQVLFLPTLLQIEKLFVLCYLVKTSSNNLVESGGLFDEHLLHGEEIPVLADRA